jgi:type IV pilus assembly protein PilA
MLARIRKAMDNREEGFTLIELLVVIIIIGILAAIAIPVFLNQRQKGYDAGAKSDARNAATIEESYMTDSNLYYASPSFTGAGIPVVLSGLGMKMSPNTTNMTIATYAAVPVAGGPVGATTLGGALAGGYCITVTSASTKVFTYSSGQAGLSTAACP